MTDASRLEDLLDAFNAHDLDRIMTFFTDDCVLEMPRGSEPWGTRFVGQAAVRVRGCDLLDLAPGGRIRRKDSYWKIVS
jgi:hypothetical protein